MFSRDPELEAAFVLWPAHLFDVDGFEFTESRCNPLVADDPVLVLRQSAPVRDMNGKTFGHLAGEGERVRQTGLVDCTLRQVNDFIRFIVNQPQLVVRPVKLGCPDAVLAAMLDETDGAQAGTGDRALALAADIIDEYGGNAFRDGVAEDPVAAWLAPCPQSESSPATANARLIVSFRVSSFQTSRA